MVESAAAMSALASDPRWSGSVVVAELATSARQYSEAHGADLDSVLTPGEDHRIPSPYWERISARLDP